MCPAVGVGIVGSSKKFTIPGKLTEGYFKVTICILATTCQTRKSSEGQKSLFPTNEEAAIFILGTQEEAISMKASPGVREVA